MRSFTYETNGNLTTADGPPWPIFHPAMTHETDIQTAQLVIRSEALARQSVCEIAHLAHEIELATETVNNSLDCIKESKKAMATAMRTTWW